MHRVGASFSPVIRRLTPRQPWSCTPLSASRMVWFNCITAFRGNLDDAASHGPLAALPRFGARVTAGGRPPVRAGADLRAQRSRLALVRCLRERRSLVLEVHL